MLLKKNKTQTVLEYTLLFAVIIGALIASFFFTDIGTNFKDYFKNSANDMTEQSLDWEEDKWLKRKKQHKVF